MYGDSVKVSNLNVLIAFKTRLSFCCIPEMDLTVIE